MAATFGWREYNTAGETESTPTNLNFGSTDATDLNAVNFPITAGTNSFEKWVKADFSGSFSRIENIKFWKSAGAYVTGESIVFKTTPTYATPSQSAMSGSSAVPASEPGSANVGIGGSTGGELTAAGKSDFIVLQQQITLAAGPGATNTKTFTISYDEV